jgi:hypothetical protein
VGLVKTPFLEELAQTPSILKVQILLEQAGLFEQVLIMTK